MLDNKYAISNKSYQRQHRIYASKAFKNVMEQQNIPYLLNVPDACAIFFLCVCANCVHHAEENCHAMIVYVLEVCYVL